MNRSRFVRRAAAGMLLLLPAVACDSLTGPETTAPSRVLLSGGGVGPSLSVALLSAEPGRGGSGGKKGPISLAEIDRIEVRITAIQLGVTPPADTTDEDSDEGGWVDLELAYDPETTWFDLKNLGEIELAAVPLELHGTIERVRLHFGDARVVFLDGSVEELTIPSGKVTVSARGVTVNQGADVRIAFAPGASVKKIIRTGRGLLMPPVFTVGNGKHDRDDGDDDDGDDDSDDDGDDDGDDDSGDDDDDSGDSTDDPADGGAGDGSGGGTGDITLGGADQ